MSVVVIADSHKLCREALCDYMRHAGAAFDINGVEDYNALRHRMEEGKADLVLINAMLPELPEYQVFPFNVGWMVADGAGHQEGATVRGVFPKTLSSKEFLAGSKAFCPVAYFFRKLKRHKMFPLLSVPPGIFI